jgi:alcohol dehydrogenase (NADP+)
MVFLFGGFMSTTTGWQSTSNSSALQRVPIERRDLRDDDIAVRVDYCGICHSDLHAIHGLIAHMKSTDALVPGHEFTGTVTAAGVAVTGFTQGDSVAVGTLVDSCGVCPMCQAGQENFCYQGPLLPSARLEEALTRLADGDVRFRFVLDMSDLDEPKTQLS